MTDRSRYILSRTFLANIQGIQKAPPEQQQLLADQYFLFFAQDWENIGFYFDITSSDGRAFILNFCRAIATNGACSALSRALDANGVTLVASTDLYKAECHDLKVSNVLYLLFLHH